MGKPMNTSKKRFTRKQLIFIVEAAIASAADRIEGILPDCYASEIEWQRYQDNKSEIGNYIQGCCNTVYVLFSILWAQTEGIVVGDGMGILDHSGADELKDYLEEFENEHIKLHNYINDLKKDAQVELNKFAIKNNKTQRKLAKKLVNENFTNDYFVEPINRVN